MKKPAPQGEVVYSKEERDEAISKMQAASDAFYQAASATHCHPFLEFCGFMNEHIKLCQQASDLMACDDCETTLRQGANGFWYSTGEPIPKPKAENENGKNRAAPFRWVKHGELTRSGESPYRSTCPVCKEGLLLIARLDNGDLNKLDSCIRTSCRMTKMRGSSTHWRSDKAATS